MLRLWSDDDAATVRLWSFTEDALIEDTPGEAGVTVVTRWGETVLAGEESVATESLRRMGFGPVSLRNSLPSGSDGAGPDAAAGRVVQRVLDRLSGAVVHSLALPDGHPPLLSLEPVVAAPLFRPSPIADDRPVRLSRFASLRPVAGVLVLEVPGSPFRAQLRQPPARTVATSLVTATTPRAVAAAAGLAAPAVLDVLSFLVAAGVALVADGDGTFAEDDDPDLAGWAHHELQFHEHHRHRTDGGASVPASELPPVTRAVPPGRRFPLHRPGAPVAGPSLGALLESDHLCPVLSDDAVSAEQLGELLHRSARIRSTGPAHLPSPAGGPGHDASQRPYHSIACLYELDLFLTLGRCAGLPRGIYHYDPLAHALTLVDETPDHVDRLLDVGRVGAGSTTRPAVLLTIAARPARISAILPGAAYAVALVHCGAFQQTLHLVAKAMGLAAHAVPSDGYGVDELLGLRGPAEVGLGECVIVVPPPRATGPALVEQ